jgi:dTDP-glucose 4,6-dehydratase
MKLLVTGGCGFIGSAFVRLALDKGVDVVNFDKLTYAGDPENVADVADHPRYSFVQGDIADADAVNTALPGCDAIINFAAETHVDRSILDPSDFIRTDVQGTATLLAAAREHGVKRFVQVSTDEVYGSIPTGSFRETDPLKPSSPYSASKAGGDMQVLAWHNTFGVDALITRGSNTFGPRQYPEKLIPLFITNAMDGLSLPVYGDGQQVRDWIFMDDHCTGIWTAFERGEAGEIYNVGGGHEMPNMDITNRIVAMTGADPAIITYVEDRLGHDRRYSLDTTKLRGLGWAPNRSFDEALEETVAWYAARRDWWEPIKSGEYLEYYKAQYGSR